MHKITCQAAHDPIDNNSGHCLARNKKSQMARINPLAVWKELDIVGCNRKLTARMSIRRIAAGRTQMEK
jgi:hypothetical protein